MRPKQCSALIAVYERMILREADAKRRSQFKQRTLGFISQPIARSVECALEQAKVANPSETAEFIDRLVVDGRNDGRRVDSIALAKSGS